MSNLIPPPPTLTPLANGPRPVSPPDESLRILAIRRVELASLSRHLERLRRRQREQEDHLAHTRKQVDALMERSRQQIAQIQSGSPERIAELEKALVQSRNDVEAQRREVARLAGEKAQLTPRLQEVEKALAQARVEAARAAELEKALAQARADLARLASCEALAARTPELEKALAQARNDVEAQRRETARLAAEKAGLQHAAGQAGKAAELEQALAQARTELDAQRKEAARMAEERSQIASKSSQLEQALTLAQSELVATRQQIDNLRQASGRIAELEELLNEAAAELEKRDQQITTLSAAPPTGAPARGGEADLEKIVAEVRAELEDLHQAELQRLNLDIEALRKGNLKLRQELQLAQEGKANGAPPGPPPPSEAVEPLKKANEELKARLAAVEISVQKLANDNQKLRTSLQEVEQERDTAIEAMEREAAQFNQQRRMLEEELAAVRKKTGSPGENVETTAPIFPTEPAEEPESPSVEIMAGFILPDPDSKSTIDLADEPLPASPIAQVNFDDGFDFARCEADLVGLHRLIENEHRCLDLELSDPDVQRPERPALDLEQHKITIDGLLHQIRRSRDALAGTPSSPPVVVAPPQPPRQKPRSTLQGLRKWLKGRE